ncbi:Hypp6204 [Branchiostoma lanceolatum]|uniref:Hypp6204 protein n=1 Tax=Branchiostoma lanceolatum TaxID=7740 RepID=A0A8J9W8Z1_BRALA|nr:Hypp6204 [Branchiostoma lanceolatum]
MAEDSLSDVEYEFDSDATYLSDEWREFSQAELEIGQPQLTSTPIHDVHYSMDSYDPSADMFDDAQGGYDPSADMFDESPDKPDTEWDPSVDMFPSSLEESTDTKDDNPDDQTAPDGSQTEPLDLRTVIPETQVVLGDQATCKKLRGAKRLRQTETERLQSPKWTKKTPEYVNKMERVMGDCLKAAVGKVILIDEIYQLGSDKEAIKALEVIMNRALEPSHSRNKGGMGQMANVDLPQGPFRTLPAVSEYRKGTFEATLRWIPKEPTVQERALSGPSALPPAQSLASTQQIHQPTAAFLQMYEGDQQQHVLGWMAPAPQATPYI